MSERQKTPKGKIYHPIRTLPDLREHLQWAFCVELSTIPPYLCALYSLVDPATDAGRSLRGVVFEEMLHMMLVSNMMNAIGGSPKLSGDFVPAYPTFIPHHASGGPFIQLQPYSASLMSVTFMGIEQPESSPRAPAEGDQFETIGQFYKAIEEGFERIVKEHGEAWVFGHDTGFQAKDTYFGIGGGRLLEVKSLKDVHAAIREIVQQGEGAPWPPQMPAGKEEFGGVDHYGNRPDGTFGPILGTPREMSHYAKFQALSIASNQPDIYPMAPNPDTSRLTGWLAELSTLCDNCYALLLRTLEKALGSSAEQRFFFGASFPLMQFALAPLSTLLMQTPLRPEIDASLGPNAGPSFSPRDAKIDEMIVRTMGLLQAIVSVQQSLGTSYAALYESTLVGVLKALRTIAESLQNKQQEAL